MRDPDLQEMLDGLPGDVTGLRAECEGALAEWGEAIPHHVERWLRATIEIGLEFSKAEAKAKCEECADYLHPPPAYAVGEPGRKRVVCRKCFDEITEGAPA